MTLHISAAPLPPQNEREHVGGVRLLEPVGVADHLQEPSQIQLHQQEAVRFITLVRPERFNALDVTTARDLHHAARQYAQEGAIRVIVLQSTGKVFCSGADLKYIRTEGEAHAKQHGGYGRPFEQIVGNIHRTIGEFRRTPKPVIAAVDGVAAAGGLGLALSADLVVASARSTFEYAYFKTALTGTEGTTFFLPKLVGCGAPLNWRCLTDDSQRLKRIRSASLVWSTKQMDLQNKSLLSLSNWPRDRRTRMPKRND